MRSLFTIVCFVVTQSAFLALALGEGVRHLPPAEASANEALRLTARVERASERTLVLQYRPVGMDTWTTLAFDRGPSDEWVAVVPAAQVQAPGVEYFIASLEASEGEAPRDEFASAAAPHQVGIVVQEREQRRARDLARNRARRSRLRVSSEYVSYGARSAEANSIADHYYRVDADFSYRLLAYPLEEIRFGYTRLEGYVPESPREVPFTCASNPESPACRKYAGFKVGGWFELGFGLAEGVRLDVRGIVVANQEGAAPGMRGELRTGAIDGNHIAVGFEYTRDVGSAGFFRLGWDTVPMVPMAATVEVTDYPASSRATGVRLAYDVFHPLPNGLRLGGRIGYAARDRRVGGATAGLSASLDF
jgi:hypothetical protein